MLKLPGWVSQRAEIKPEPEAGHDPNPLVEQDQPHFREWAVQYLSHAPIAIEGRHGDDTTYKVACTLRGRGLSEDVAFELMLEHYNDRCVSPWPTEGLKAKVQNAYLYGRNRPGADTAEAVFDDEPPAIPVDKQARQRFLLLDDLLKLPPPEWMVKGLLPMNSVGVLYGASQTFKSFFAFHLAACCSVGIPAFKGKPSKTAEAFYVAAEGAHGFKLRAEAWIRHHNMRPESLRVLPASVFLDRENEAEQLATDILSVATPNFPRLIVVDTLSANFTGKENTDEVAGFLRKCSLLAQKTSATVLVLHHTGKDGQKEERGHYSIRANVDFSIKVERRGMEPRISVEVKKLKDAPIGERLHLTATKIEVAPGEEFSDSLVLDEESAVVRDFARSDLEESIAQLIRESDGRNLIEVAQAANKDHGISVSRAKVLIKKFVETSEGAISLERTNKKNSRSGLIVRIARSKDSNPTPESEF
jgi:hypothetical protein